MPAADHSVLQVGGRLTGLMKAYGVLQLIMVYYRSVRSSSQQGRAVLCAECRRLSRTTVGWWRWRWRWEWKWCEA